MFLFCKKEILLLLFVQLRKSPGIGLELESSPGNESPGIWIKSWKWKSWNLNQVLEMKVLEFESIFLVGTMILLYTIAFLVR